MNDGKLAEIRKRLIATTISNNCLKPIENGGTLIENLDIS